MTTTANEFLVSEAPLPRRPEPETDQYDRYKLPDPETGEIRSWTRATTFASVVMDERRFDSWKTNKTAIGLAYRPDLVAKIANIRDHESDDGKERLRDLVRDAQTEGGTKTKAHVGTALHEYLAAIDDNWISAVPDRWKADVDAYYSELARTDITISRNYIERVCLCPSIGVAGTMDRLGRFKIGDPFVLDLKTGDIKKSLPEHAIQIAIYAHSTHCWDPTDGQLLPMPKVQQDTAILMHLPAGEGRAQALYIDIKAGWEMVEHCLAVREWRSRKNLATPVLPVEGK